MIMMMIKNTNYSTAAISNNNYDKNIDTTTATNNDHKTNMDMNINKETRQVLVLVNFYTYAFVCIRYT